MYKPIYLPVFLGFFFFVSNLSAQNNVINLTGKWEDAKNKVSYEFNTDSSVMLYQHGQGTLINSYKLDLTKDPAWIDFTISLGSQSMVIMSLLKVIDENTIWIEQGNSFGDHPTEFREDNSYINRKHVLTRQLDN